MSADRERELRLDFYDSLMKRELRIRRLLGETHPLARAAKCAVVAFEEERGRQLLAENVHSAADLLEQL